jgi:hypothetical protein
MRLILGSEGFVSGYVIYLFKMHCDLTILANPEH